MELTNKANGANSKLLELRSGANVANSVSLPMLKSDDIARRNAVHYYYAALDKGMQVRLTTRHSSSVG